MAPGSWTARPVDASFLPAEADVTPADAAIHDVVAAAVSQADDAISRIAVHEAVGSVWTIVDALNGYITEQEPWALAKDPAQAGRFGPGTGVARARNQVGNIHHSGAMHPERRGQSAALRQTERRVQENAHQWAAATFAGAP